MFSLFLSLIDCRHHHRSHVRHHRNFINYASNSNGVGRCTSSIGVNIRSGPSTGYGVIGTLGNGGTITITGNSNDWWKVSYNGQTGYAKAEYFTVGVKVTPSIGLNLRSSASTSASIICGMPCGAQCTAIDCTNGWYKVQYNGATGWASSDYLDFTGGSGGGGSTPSGTVIRQGNSAFNSNIRNWGCAFMSSCWCGGVNSINGCNNLYNQAVANGWMRSDCYILNWATMATGCGKARSYKWASSSYSPASNEKEILWCKNSRTSSHFVVGNGRGGIEYDPAYDGSVSYRDCFEKRIFVY